MTPSKAYEAASKLYRLQRKAGKWSVLGWRPGLGCWERFNSILRRGDAIQERAGLVTAHALMLLGLNQAAIAALLRKHYTGPARQRVAAAYTESRTK